MLRTRTHARFARDHESKTGSWSPDRLVQYTKAHGNVILLLMLRSPLLAHVIAARASDVKSLYGWGLVLLNCGCQSSELNWAAFSNWLSPPPVNGFLCKYSFQNLGNHEKETFKHPFFEHLSEPCRLAHGSQFGCKDGHREAVGMQRPVKALRSSSACI